MVFTYPHWHETMAGIDAGTVKQFTSRDVKAMAEAFKMLTGVDPLAKGAKVDEVWQYWLEQCDRIKNTMMTPGTTPSNAKAR